MLSRLFLFLLILNSSLEAQANTALPFNTSENFVADLAFIRPNQPQAQATVYVKDGDKLRFESSNLQKQPSVIILRADLGYLETYSTGAQSMATRIPFGKGNAKLTDEVSNMKFEKVAEEKIDGKRAIKYKVNLDKKEYWIWVEQRFKGPVQFYDVQSQMTVKVNRIHFGPEQKVSYETPQGLFVLDFTSLTRTLKSSVQHVQQTNAVTPTPSPSVPAPETKGTLRMPQRNR